MSTAANQAVFLSYASQDAEAARRICEALRSGGVEVWFDADGGLEHGDEWDAKIRKQIKECVLFIPVISANTQAREEGYFRLEWDLAAERARTIASGVPFILPVVIDDTREPDALVPDRFRMVQWTRLPGGVVTPEVKARYLKLWSHRVGAFKHTAAAGRDRPKSPSEASYADAARSADPALLPQPVRRIPAVVWIAAIVAVAAIAASFYFVTLRLKSAAGASQSAAVAKEPAPALSEAQQLVTKVFGELERISLDPPILTAAEGLARRAAGLEPLNPEAWAAWSQVDSWFGYLNYDASPQRIESARANAGHALRLAPNSFEARLAQAVYLVRAHGEVTLPPDPAQVESMLNGLLKEKPDHPRALLTAAILARNRRHLPDARALLGRLAQNPAFAAMAWWELGYCESRSGDSAAAEVAADRSIQIQPHSANLSLKLYLAMLRGDLEAAEATLNRVPADIGEGDKIVSIAARIEHWRRDHKTMLRRLERINREWLSSVDYDGPIALWLGVAREMAGQAEAARFQWEIGLKLVERRLAVNASSGALIKWKGVLLALLGQKDESEKFLKLASEMKVGPREGPPQSVWVHARLLNGQAESVMNEIELKPGSFNFSDGYLRLDPFFDSLRANPRFQAFLAKQRREAAGGTMDVAERVQSVDAKSVAVLPFVNQSADKDNEYFSDGIADELLTTLQKIPGLRVAARTSAWSFKGKNPTAQEVGEKLGMAHVVEGSVQKSGTKVKITARLSRAATNEELWSKSYGPLELTDVFATQSEIATAIVGELRGRLTGEVAVTAKTEIAAQVQDAVSGGTRNVEAHELYLRARFLTNQFTMEGLRHAEGLLQQTVVLDSQFALGWAALAQVGRLRSGFETSRASVDAGFELARRASARAVELAPKLPAAYLARLEFQLVAFDWSGAAASLRRMVELAPDSAHESELKVAGAFGERDRAVAAGRRAVALDPVNPELRMNYAFSLLNVRRFAEAEAEFRRVAEMSPAAPYGHAGAALAMLLQGKNGEATAEASREVPDWSRAFAVALTQWGEGKREKSDVALAELIRKDAEVAAYQIAQVYAFRHDFDRAFEWLERALRQRDPGLINCKVDVVLAALHTDPRWPAFLKKVGLHDDQLK